MAPASLKDNSRLVYLFILVFILLPLSFLSAEGVTILRHNGYDRLLVDSAGMDGSPGECIGIQLAGEGKLKLTGNGETREFRFSAGKNPVRIYLYSSLTNLIPEQITISDTSPDYDLVSADIIRRETPDAPVPADIGHIIFSGFDGKNGEKWRLYSWNLAPSVLIFDTINYAVQSRLFKRLAFFVEKPGYTGRLVPNEVLEGKHGWNAHDYKAEDLADFFSLAAESGFKLNDEEIFLREQLTEYGIIIRTADNKYKAGSGAVLSVSRETLPDWRYRFLTHECLHGLFFTNREFRDDMFTVFGQLQPEEVEFWKHLLDYRQYDVENPYLLVNEYMAYILQQPVNETDEYFKGFMYTRMTAARPYEKDFVADFERNFPESFTNSVYSSEKILYNIAGRLAGHLANIYPAELKDSFFNLFPPLF